VTSKPAESNDPPGQALRAMPPAAPPRAAAPQSSARFAALVGLGIFTSRVAGLVRERAFAHFFGNSWVADAVKAAFRIPNLLQNLFGEGVLSASFIPVYARLLAERDEQEARRVAGAVAAALGLAMSALVLLGMLATPWLIDLVAPGFEGERRALTVTLVRVLFPGVALLVMSAWCLGILNSHRRFFLSYAAPVLWNAVIIAVMLAVGPQRAADSLAVWVAGAAVVGSAAQLGVQLPRTLRLAGHVPLELGVRDPSVQTVFRNFAPAFVSRGVLQISAYVDQLLASLLPLGAVAALGYAQTLYTLPVSLFGMSISAAELPLMSSALGSHDEIAGLLRARLEAAMRRVAFFIVPSAMAFAVLGDVIAAAIYRTGRFGDDDVLYVWGILAGSAVGLLASTLARLFAATFYALRDTRTPLRFACVRLAATVVLGIAFAFPFPRLVGIEPRWGAAGLTLSAGLAGWLELALLRRALVVRIGRAHLASGLLAKLWGAAGASAAAALAIERVAAPAHPVLVAAAVLGPYGALYLGGTLALGIPEARALVARAGARLAAWR
jgi:putative peptidoglycan lipid II flippase